MRKRILLFAISSILANLHYSQETNSPMGLANRTFGSAPDAGNLMKFEENPVSHYTGIPDISIPLVSMSSTDKITMSIGLKYHPASTKIDDKASEVGLGWNLIAGGTITRTVKGLPDDQIVMRERVQLPDISVQTGIYHENSSQRNWTAKYIEYINGDIASVGWTEHQRRKFLFEGSYFNRFDTEYDVYQYNFMGYTGKFIIKKKANGSFEVLKLDKNNLKITSIHSSNYEPTSFLIIDDKGFSYKFNTSEKISRRSWTTGNLLSGKTYESDVRLGESNNSFYLTSIEDQLNNELVKLDYTQTTQEVAIPDPIKQIARYNNYYVPSPGPGDPDPLMMENTSVTSWFRPKLLNYIEVKNKGRIYFTYSGTSDVRYDTNLSGHRKLNKVTLKDLNGNVIQEKRMTYGYFDFNGNQKRLRLDNVETFIKDNNSNNLIKLDEYKLGYKNANGLQLSTDLWGYNKCNNSTTECIDINVLNSMTLPSKGTIVYAFEPNTYSNGFQYNPSTYYFDWINTSVPLHGGGIRIRSITHYDMENPTSDSTFQKQVNYSYNDVNNPSRSSGALIYPVPIYTYNNGSMTVSSNKDLLTMSKSEGDIGYKYVTVSETGLGKTIYEIRSPSDFPNLDLPGIDSPSPTFQNYDYLRGQTINVTIKNENNEEIQKQHTQLLDTDFYEDTPLIGANLVKTDEYAGTCKTYECLISNSSDPQLGSMGGLYEVVGLAKPSAKTQETIVNGATLTETSSMLYTSYDYIKKQTTAHADGSVTEKSYLYPTDLSSTSNSQTDYQTLVNANMISIPLITETKNNGNRTSKTETVYSPATNLLPTSVLTYDLDSENSKKEVDFKYDSFGNLVEYKNRAGLPTAVIWGYNNTSPIAKIEGVFYNDIVASAGTVVGITNNLNSTEQSVINELKNFRNASSVRPYQVTTYTYDRIAGITSITSPQGLTDKYEYDAANRLKRILKMEPDSAGNTNYEVAKEFQYNYK